MVPSIGGDGRGEQATDARGRALRVLEALAGSDGPTIRGSVLQAIGQLVFTDACVLARRDAVPSVLVAKLGNVGAPGWPPAPPGNVHFGLSALGAIYLRRPEARPTIDLVLGDLHVDGAQPPLDADWVLRAVDGEDGLDELPPIPALPSRSSVTGDMTALCAGDIAIFELAARITSTPAELRIDRVPIDEGAWPIATAVSDHGNAGHLRGGGWQLTMPSDTEVVLTARDRSAEPRVLELLDSAGLTRRSVEWRLRAPLAALLLDAREAAQTTPGTTHDLRVAIWGG
jgi:hypothetical protein